MSAFVVPRDDQHFVEVGKNGSGKTQAGLYWLLQRLGRYPWIILDTKGDALIDEIGPVELGLTDKLPTKPGLYVVRAIPKVHDALVEALLWRIWRHENIGVFIDEGYNLPEGSEAFTALLTQGRSKRIPLHILSQRPVWMDRFTFSEAAVFNVFFLNDRRDRATVQSFVPYDMDVAFGPGAFYPEGPRLPPYWSIWHDVGLGTTHILRPVPDRDTIISLFRTKLGARRRFL